MPTEVAILARPSDDAAAIRLALDYPYARHPEAFWFADGRVGHPADAQAARAGRTPVLAYGSNASPLQIARKFAGRPCGDQVYVEPVTLSGWDAVYAARITRYGAIPARMVPTSGCVIAVHLTWLTDAQLDWMDCTEGAMYVRSRLGDGSVVDASDTAVGGVQAYLEGGLPLMVDGLNAALAAIPATGRLYPGHRTGALLQRLACAARFEGAVEAFALRLVCQPGYKDAVLPLLRRGL